MFVIVIIGRLEKLGGGVLKNLKIVVFLVKCIPFSYSFKNYVYFNFNF